MKVKHCKKIILSIATKVVKQLDVSLDIYLTLRFVLRKRSKTKFLLRNGSEIH